MTFLIQGIEERKNKEIAQLHGVIEEEIKEEHNRFIRKLVRPQGMH
jgi:low affinity Fe/Cu permease